MNCSVQTRACLVACLTLPFAVHADHWPQWRGPHNDGISAAKNLPTRWDPGSNIVWKVKLPGEGGSTPAIWGERIFLTCQDRSEIRLLCLNRDGKELWRRALGPAIPWARTNEGNGASASPSTDGKQVYAFAGNGTCAAFDLDGKEAWRFNTQERYGKFDIQFGMHSTPVLHGNRLYLQLLHTKGQWVACIDTATGAPVWKIQRPSDGTDENEHSYASAFLWSNARDAYLVVHGNDYTTAHQLSDGKEIWRLGDLNPQGDTYNRYLRFVASPLCTPELIVVPTAKNGPVVGLRPEAKGTVGKGSKFEQWRIDRGTPDVPCPLIHDGLVYLCRETGELLVLDANTGAQVYRRPTHNHRHRASPVYADGKIYLTSRDGVVTVVAAGREFKKLATNKLPDQTAASPAIAHGRIYLRGFDYLWAIGEAK